MNQFIKLAQSVKADVFVKYKSLFIDASSVVGMYSLDFSEVIELKVIEKADGEYDKLVEKLRELGIVTE
jgi:phosphotransferase system HPr-like phosphotransfer protein